MYPADDDGNHEVLHVVVPTLMFREYIAHEVNAGFTVPAESREFLPEAWWYATAPGLAIFLVVMGFNLLGDGLRDALDPRIRGR